MSLIFTDKRPNAKPIQKIFIQTNIKPSNEADNLIISTGINIKKIIASITA
jgi:hypothetical protein